MHRAVPAALALVVALGLTGCAGRAGAATAPSASPSAGGVRMDGDAAVIGALPDRSSVLIHGAAPLAPLDRYLTQDLTTLAKGEGKDPDDVLRDYAAQPAFDAVAAAAEADPNYADAVFHPGVHGVSELRFVDRPPRSVVAALRARYPRDLRVEWGDRLAGEDARDRFSSTVFGIVLAQPGAGRASTGIDGDGRLTVEFDGPASPRSIAEGLVATPTFRSTFVDGAPPTEVRVVHVEQAAITTW